MGPADDARPALSPDGTTIAYTHGGAIWTMRRDGSRPRRLAGRARQFAR